MDTRPRLPVRLRRPLARIVRAVAVAVAALALTLGPAGPPAHAATTIYAYLGINIDGIYLPNDGQIYSNAWINVHLPMNQYDAQGYINNGARIEIECWGDDSVFDDILTYGYVATGEGTGDYYLHGAGVTVHGVNRLYADASGVSLTAIIGAPRHKAPLWGFNEDNQYPEVTDEVYCKVTWIDGDGAKLTATTNVTKGDF